MTAAPRYISAEQVRSLLTWPMVNEAVEEALKAVGAAADANTPYARQPVRTLTICDESREKLLFTMPGYVGNYELSKNVGQQQIKQKRSTLACKIVTSFTANERRVPPLPNILANILLFNVETGQLECIMDATQITAWRTAAASIVATKYFYFKRFNVAQTRAIKVAIIGCGVQGRSHALGMCATFRVSHIALWNRTVSKAQALAEELRAASPDSEVLVTNTAAEAVADADVICVGTYAATALITYDMLRKRDIHINTVGAGKVHFGEVGLDIYDKARVYIDSWSNAKTELKDLPATIVAEVGEIIRTGKYAAPEGITIFQSLGMAAEDVTVGQAVFEALQNANQIA